MRAKKLLYAVYKGDVRELRHFIPTVYNPNQMFYTTPDSAVSASHLGALAIVNNKPEVLRILLRAGLSTGAITGKKMSLFSEAASVKYVSPEIVDMLFVPVNDGDFLNDQPFEAGYNTTAHLAVLNNNSYLLDRLLRMGKSCLVATLRNATGDTALTLAIKLSRYNGGSMAMRLARYTEEVTKESWSSVVENSGYNALELAEANQLHEVVKILTAPRRPDGSILCSLCRGVVNNDDDESGVMYEDNEDNEGSMQYDYDYDGRSASYLSERDEVDTARRNAVIMYEQIISGLTRQHTAEKEAAEERYTKALERIKYEADIEVDKLKEDVSRLNTELNTMRVHTNYYTTFLDHDDDDGEVARILRELDDQKKVNEDLDKRMAEREEYFARERAVRDTAIETLKNSLRDERAAAEKQLQDVNREHKNNLDALTAEYKKHDTELEDELTKNNIQHAAEITRMRADHEQTIINLLEAHDKEKQRLETEYEADKLALDQCMDEIRRLKGHLATDLDKYQEDDEKKEKKKTKLYIKSLTKK